MKTHRLLFIFLLIVITNGGSTAQVTSINENFDATTGSAVPANWGGSAVLGTNYGTGNFYADHTSGTGRFAFMSNGYLISELISSGPFVLDFWMRISSTPVENIEIGYCTNPSNIASTFTSLLTIPNNTTVWTEYFVPVTLPTDAYITWSCAGTSKTHCIDDVGLEFQIGVGENPGTESSFSVFPSPAKDNLNISWSGLTGHYRVVLYDMQGREIDQLMEGDYQSGKNNQKINISDIAHGTYFLGLKSDKTICVKKIVIFP